jgi:hypothetical protein
MPIDPSIPLGVRAPQLESPMNALAQAQSFSLNNLKMQEAEQSMADRDYVRGLDINAPDYISRVGRVNPKLALELQKSQLESKKGQVELEAKLITNARNTLAPINDQGTYDLWRQQTSAQLPGLTKFLPAKFDDKVKTSLMLEADKYIQQTQISAAQQAQLGQSERHFQIGQQGAGQALTDASGNVTVLDKQGNVMRQLGNIGKPSATFEKTAALQKQQGRDLGLAITELESATKDKGLIDQSTGSGIGRLADVSAGFVGQATPGAIAIAKLKPIADMALKMVPRFEGPQSDKDTQSYKEAAGQLADPSLPTDLRKAAGKEVLRLMKARKNQFVNEAMANEGIGAGAGVDTSNPLLK